VLERAVLKNSVKHPPSRGSEGQLIAAASRRLASIGQSTKRFSRTLLVPPLLLLLPRSFGFIQIIIRLVHRFRTHPFRFDNEGASVHINPIRTEEKAAGCPSSRTRECHASTLSRLMHAFDGFDLSISLYARPLQDIGWLLGVQNFADNGRIR